MDNSNIILCYMIWIIPLSHNYHQELSDFSIFHSHLRMTSSWKNSYKTLHFVKHVSHVSSILENRNIWFDKTLVMRIWLFIIHQNNLKRRYTRKQTIYFCWTLLYEKDRIYSVIWFISDESCSVKMVLLIHEFDASL
jgi:hypothetical protein